MTSSNKCSFSLPRAVDVRKCGTRCGDNIENTLEVFLNKLPTTGLSYPLHKSAQKWASCEIGGGGVYMDWAHENLVMEKDYTEVQRYVQEDMMGI